MKKVTRLLTALLALLLVGLLVACDKAPSADEPVEIMFTYYLNGTVPADLEKVQAAINIITEREIGVKVKLNPLSSGTYKDQINLALASGERLDVFAMNGSRFASYVSSGQILPLNDLLESHGQGILENVSQPLLDGCSVNGEVYGIMPVRDIAQGGALYIRKDYVDKYNLDLSQIKSFQDVGNILSVIKAEEPNMYPLVIENNLNYTPVEVCLGKDNVSDSFGVLMYEGDPYSIVDYYSSDIYREYITTLREWFLAGYISPDVVTNTESISTQMKAGNGVCYFYKTKTGMDVQESKANNCEMVHVDILEPFISTYNVQLLSYGIAQQCEHPEEAMMFLNMLYTNKDVLNLLNWGIEGTHYVHTEDGHITYPEGVDATTSSYNVNMSWAFGYTFNNYIWEGNDLDLVEDSKAALANAKSSETLGFTYDSSAVKAEVAALQNVVAEYRMGLESGFMDISNLDKFIEKLQEAGIDTVVAEKQRQLSAWVESQK